MKTAGKKYRIALSFDVEEFDLPEEHGVALPLERQIGVSSEGLVRVLDLLEKTGVRATFFCTVNYACRCPDLIRRIVEQGHEIASHSYYHSRFETADLLRSRIELGKMTGVEIRGFRSPRMGCVSPSDLLDAGYRWDSSLNPCFVPGRYNHSGAPRGPFVGSGGLIEIPASVGTCFRIPLFWLALHVFPLEVYLWLCKGTLRSQRLLNVYFHPWEFSEELGKKEYKVPGYIVRNSGKRLADRLETVIRRLGGDAEFATLSEIAGSLTGTK